VESRKKRKKKQGREGGGDGGGKRKKARAVISIRNHPEGKRRGKDRRGGEKRGEKRRGNLFPKTLFRFRGGKGKEGGGWTEHR